MSIPALARDTGIAEWTPYRWRNKVANHGAETNLRGWDQYLAWRSRQSRLFYLIPSTCHLPLTFSGSAHRPPLSRCNPPKQRGLLRMLS